MVSLLVLPSVELASPTRCCILNSRLATTFLQLVPLPKPRMTRLQLELSWMLSNLTRKSSVLATLRFSSGPESLVGWKKPVRTGLVLFLPGCSLVPEVRLLGCSSRSCKIRSLHFMPVRGLLGPSCLLRPGNGSNCGWRSSQTSSVPSLENTRQNLKTKLLRLMPILTEQLHSAMQLLL